MILTSLNTSSGGGGSGGAPSGAPNPTRIRRGIVVSFDPDDWTAIVTLDGSLGAVTLPVAESISGDALNTGDTVAVLLFDDTNPNDAVVVAAYGGLGNPLSQPSAAELFERLIMESNS